MDNSHKILVSLFSFPENETKVFRLVRKLVSNVFKNALSCTYRLNVYCKHMPPIHFLLICLSIQMASLISHIVVVYNIYNIYNK